MIKLGKKFKHFVRRLDLKKLGVDEEILEGQTSAGKTTVGIGLKFILLCSLSPKKLHLLCGNTIGKVESNVIIKDNGIKDIARQLGYEVDYFPNGKGEIRMPHLVLYGPTPDEDKIIYLAGYSDESKWKDVLGSQYGIVAVDEANIANINFLRELAMRRDYWMLTLNPDDPTMEIYSDIINRSRPLPEYEKDYPEELLSQLKSRPAKKSSIHWYFTMDDNVALSEEKKKQIRESLPEGSKTYKNKILGLRGRSEGLVFAKFERNRQVIELDEFSFMPNEYVYKIINGLDSGLNVDATSCVPILLTSMGRRIIIPTMYYEPEQGSNASSDQAYIIERWIDYWTSKFGVFNPNGTSICGDSAALTQTVILELIKRTKYANSYPVKDKDRVRDTMRAIAIMEESFPDGSPKTIIVNAGYIDPITFEKKGDTDMFIVELENIVWDKKKGNVAEDGNDHAIDAFKYGTYEIYYGGAY